MPNGTDDENHLCNEMQLARELLDIPNLGVEPGKFVDVIVSSVRGADNFFAQPLIYKEAIEKFQQTLNQFYGLLSPHEMKVPASFLVEPNEFCVARSSKDGCFYRAQYLERESPSLAKVLFVDYGHQELVPLISIKTLIQYFSFDSMPAFAFNCHDVFAVTIDGELFKSRVENRICCLKIINLNDNGQAVQVEVFEIDIENPGTELNISQELAGTRTSH